MLYIDKFKSFALLGCDEKFPTSVSRKSVGKEKEKHCGTRNFKEEDESTTKEFPWSCSVFTLGIRGKKEKYLGGCTIIPNEPDNDILKPTYRAVTAAKNLMLAEFE